MKYASKLIFCRFSKPSEKTACVQKKVCRNSQRSLRCRYERREKSKRPNRIFFSLDLRRRSITVFRSLNSKKIIFAKSQRWCIILLSFQPLLFFGVDECVLSLFFHNSKISSVIPCPSHRAFEFSKRLIFLLKDHYCGSSS